MLNVNESAKALHHNNVQAQMTQTFHMSILNNSFTNIGVKPMLTTTHGQSSPFGTYDKKRGISPRAVRSLASETFAPFTVIPNAKIPDLTDSRREDREERVMNLLRRPKHKENFRGSEYSVS